MSKPQIVVHAGSPLHQFTAGQLASMLGGSEGHAYRSLRGLPVGSGFIAAAKVQFPNRSFEEMFSVVHNGVLVRKAAPKLLNGSERAADLASVVSTWDEAQAAGWEEHEGAVNPVTDKVGPRTIPIKDGGVPIAAFEDDGGIRLLSGWRESEMMRLILEKLEITPETITSMVIPPYMVAGQRNSEMKDVD